MAGRPAIFAPDKCWSSSSHGLEYRFATDFSAPFPNWINKNAPSAVLYLHPIASKCILFRRLYCAFGGELLPGARGS
jgi:hypothetical protein